MPTYWAPTSPTRELAQEAAEARLVTEPQNHEDREKQSATYDCLYCGEHLERIRDGRIETITQNGQAVMIVK